LLSLQHNILGDAENTARERITNIERLAFVPEWTFPRRIAAVRTYFERRRVRQQRQPISFVSPRT
jgi:hypothetical protein